MTISDLEYTKPQCPAAYLGGCTSVMGCPETDMCMAARTDYDPNCYNGPVASKAANGCANVLTDCICGVTPNTCPATLMGGCRGANCLSGGAAVPCSVGGSGYDAVCYNGPVHMKVGMGCMALASDCDCPVGG